MKPPVLADAIVEAAETGSTLSHNRLRILDTVMESNTQFIANGAAMAAVETDEDQNISLLLKAAIRAHGRVGVMLNVRREDLQAVLALLPRCSGQPSLPSVKMAGWPSTPSSKKRPFAT